MVNGLEADLAQETVKELGPGNAISLVRDLTEEGCPEELVALAKSRGLFLLEGMWTRFFPAVVKAHELLEERAASARRGAHTGPVRAGLGCCRRAPSARLSR